MLGYPTDCLYCQIASACLNGKIERLGYAQLVGKIQLGQPSLQSNPSNVFSDALGDFSAGFRLNGPQFRVFVIVPLTLLLSEEYRVRDD